MEIIVTADMPGVDERTVNITLEKNILSIYGRVEPVLPEKHKLIYYEYGIGDYQRTFTLTDEVDRDKIQASEKTGLTSCAAQS